MRLGRAVILSPSAILFVKTTQFTFAAQSFTLTNNSVLYYQHIGSKMKQYIELFIDKRKFTVL